VQYSVFVNNRWKIDLSGNNIWKIHTTNLLLAWHHDHLNPPPSCFVTFWGNPPTLECNVFMQWPLINNDFYYLFLKCFCLRGHPFMTFKCRENGHCSSYFKGVVCISCRWRVDVHKGTRGTVSCGHGVEWVKNVDFLLDVINGWMDKWTPNEKTSTNPLTSHMSCSL